MIGLYIEMVTDISAQFQVVEGRGYQVTHTIKSVDDTGFLETGCDLKRYTWRIRETAIASTAPPAPNEIVHHCPEHSDFVGLYLNPERLSHMGALFRPALLN